MMFVLKKLLAAFFLPPGLIVTLLFVSAVVFWRRKIKTAAFVNLMLGVLLWVICLVPVSDALVRGLERGLPRPDVESADVVIVLSGYGDRTAPALQLQRRLNVPIIFAGYISLSHSSRDRENFFRLLEGWGVP
ncbi:MAG: hypothetical protein JW747_04120, partial [Candidatus Aminicenantes bacterium]|nr:hypothetical protein [Candidatus Aminicenantes bacterium]